jgi:hypothetical protein
MILTDGYTTISTSAYTISGSAPVTVTKSSGNDKLSWNSTARKIDIAGGLAPGVYEVQLSAVNGVANHTFTFTLTVLERKYPTSIQQVVGGSATAFAKEANLAAVNETVTLTITPETGFELVSINAYDYDRPSVAIPLSGTGLTRTFTMPAYHVSVVPTFRTGPVQNETLNANGLKAYAQNSTLYVSGLMAGELWSVYNASGTLIYQSIATGDKDEVALPGRGIYIVHRGNDVIKITN